MTSVQELHFNPTPMKRCLLLVWVIQKKMTSGTLLPQNGVQNKLTWKHHKWSTVNECWQRTYCHDENDEVNKWDEWSWWNDIDENEDVDEQRVHEEFINGHEWNTVMTYSTLKVKRKHALKDKIIDKKCHDEERWLQVPGGVYTSLTTKLKGSYEEVLTKRRQDGCQEPDEKRIVWTETSKRLRW